LLAAVPFSLMSNLPFPIGTLMAERLLYLPSAGLCLLAGAAWPALARRAGRPAAVALAVAVLLAGSIRTVAADAVWKDDFTLYSAAISASPRSVRVLGNLAVELAARGRLGEAEPLLERAVALAPDFAPNRINLSGVLLKEGSLDAAEVEIRHVLDREPGHPVALLQLASILSRRGDAAGAEDALERALAADPSLEAAREDLRRLRAMTRAGS
jgi:predicted Zn-dependent protease